MSVPIEQLVVACPNLTDLVMAGFWDWGGKKSDDHLGFCSFLLDFPKLSRLGIGDCESMNLNLGALSEKRSISCLWLEGKNGRHADSKNRIVLGMTEGMEAQLIDKMQPLEYVRTMQGLEKLQEKLSKTCKTKILAFEGIDYDYPKICNYSWRRK